MCCRLTGQNKILVHSWKATVGASRKGHGSLAGRHILEGFRTRAQGTQVGLALLTRSGPNLG